MSIELTGPRKYKFQDHVCVLLSILAATDVDMSLEVEPQDGEDALIALRKGGETHFIEIQVKGAEGHIKAESLADWLAHFPARRADDSLLERLVNDGQRSVLFVASGRCDDATVVHTIPLSVHTTSLDPGKVKRETEAGIRAALQAYAEATSSTDKDLAKSRRAHIGTQLPLIPRDALKNALQRVLISEQLDDAEVLRRSREALKSLHQVVPDQVEDVLSQIESIVFREKRSKNDLLPEIAKVIASGKAGDPLVGASYVQRREEAALLDGLSRKYAILITGAPRVGKSSCARSIAATLQRQGYSVRVCDNLGEAERFLTEPVIGSRVALVDDPLGGAHAAENADRELNLLERLIPKLTNGRRLIVAQAQDRLLEVARLESVEKIVTAGLSWVPMGIGDTGFLTAVWIDAATAYSVPADLTNQVVDAITSADMDLEPGCLVHLAANYSRLEGGAKINDLVRFARQDSKSLGSALRKEKLAPLLNALAVASTQELHVAETELAFILDSERVDRPGESDVVGTMLTFGGEDTVRVSPPPSYVPVPILSQEAIDSLEHLELRRIVADKGRRYTFSHPFYRASAESLLDAATHRSTAAAISLVGRALFTISPDAARAAATNLVWIYQNLGTQAGQEGIIALAIKGLRSIFPVVRDLCFQFLVRRLSALPVEQQEGISSWVRKVNSTELSYVEWEDDQPRIPAATFSGALEVDPFPQGIAYRDVEGTLALLNSERPVVISNEVAAGALMYLEEHPDAMTEQMAARLLSYDVSLIRSLAAKTWLSRPRSDDAAIIERIFSEEHPAVAEAVYLGVIAAWPSCNEERRRMLTRSMQTMAASPVSAVVLIEQLVVIARKEYGGETTPWELFEAVMPVVLRELPFGASFRDERLYDVMDSAVENISQSSLLEIIDRWIELVEEFASGGVPSDYLLGVSDILVLGVDSKSGERDKRIERLLALPGTACRIRIVSDLVDSWNQLSERERSLLLNHLTVGSSDSVWLQAAALTRSTVPAEIQSLVLPSGIDISSAPNEVIARIPSQLLNACLNVFTGYNPVIYYVGAQGARRSAWNAIARAIACMPTHPMFEACWEWLATTEEPTVLAKVATELGADYSERVARLLLERKRRTSGEFMLEVWDALFELPVSDEVKSDWIARMADIAPNALDSLYEYKSWIPESHHKEFLSHFKEDIGIVMRLHKLREALHDSRRDIPISKDLSSLIVESLHRLIDETPPRHWSTYDVVTNLLGAFNIEDEPLAKVIKERRSKGIEEAHERPERVVPELAQWEGRC
ncbi:hypothetical protein [Paraburkholderia sp. BL6669N2]|uniref:nSTAND3 domain-containing NTPase n=1 Tax=Paraburkholderia sp. BL6669N2 TaxID=1938807 RepID=UPI000E26E419|nr:hypothetical protein [Paraburkholderia sp. BL6669N2]